MTRTSQPQPIDRSAVKLTCPYEVAFWMRKLGLSRNELFSAVAAAGDELPAVRRHIHRSRLISPRRARRPGAPQGVDPRPGARHLQ